MGAGVLGIKVNDLRVGLPKVKIERFAVDTPFGGERDKTGAQDQIKQQRKRFERAGKRREKKEKQKKDKK